MKKLIIDRFDGIYYFCSDKEKKFFAIEAKEMPKEAKVGNTIQIDDDGKITVLE